LASACGEIQFDIWGPIDDGAYWETCQEQIRRLPNSIHVSYKGPVPQEQVRHVFAEYHFQILPTLGENFGYVILEALAAGCPVFISNQTPWRNLQAAGIGWDLPLGMSALWQHALQECIAMDDGIYQAMSQRARNFAERWVSSPFFHRDSVSLFRGALDSIACR
jgi:glycosyltransferase involved in cell wall biosynthesis